MTNVTLSRYENDGRTPPLDVVIGASKLYSVDFRWLATGEEPPQVEAPELVAIPVLGDIPAGVPMERALSHHAEEHIAVDLAGLATRGDILFALRVDGRSMVGFGIYPGDYAVCSMVQSYAVGDVVALYQMETGDSTIKQLGAWKPGNRTIQLIPHNGEEGLLPFRVDLGASDQLRRVVLIVRRYRTRL